MSEIYKVALQKKLRFRFRGVLSVEDLFDLGDVDLDVIYRDLKSQQGDDDVGLLQKRTRADEELALALEIVEDVYSTKKAEADKKKEAAKKKEKKNRLLEIMAKKKDKELEEMSVEELEEMVKDL